MINFTILLFKFIDDYELIETEVYRRAEIDRKLFSKIRCGQVPSKKTIIKLCLSIGLTLEESELLLMKAGYGDIYFDSKEKAEQAIEVVGKDRIKKYYLRVE